MVVVAVAGGSGGLGRTIVEELERRGRQKIIVLGRKPPRIQFAGTTQFESIDYENIDATVAILEKYKVDTIISTIGVMMPGANQAQLNLIEASRKSPVTRRFIPSEYATIIQESDSESMFAPVIDAIAALRASGLEFTRVNNGYLMDYLGLPHIPSHMPAFSWGIDVPNRRAVIPGSGDDLFTLTYTFDIARFVVRLLEDDKWSEYSNISGSDMTLNQIVAIAERITGSKFNVTYDTLEDLKQGKVTLLREKKNKEDSAYEESPELLAMFGIQLVGGELLIPQSDRLNTQYPEIQPLSIENMLLKAWGA